MHKNLPLILSASGFGLMAFGMLGTWYLFPKIVTSQIHANIDLREGTMGYDTWKKQPFPLKFKVYFFNVSNPDEVQLGGKPVLKEIGPYIYDEYRERINIELNEEKDTIKYVLKKYFFFNQEESNGLRQDDIVTIVNAALVGTALQVQMMLPTAIPMVNEAVPYLFPSAKNIFLTAKVRELLFDGIVIHCNDPEVDFICTAMKGSLPKTIQLASNQKDFIFSMFRHLNGTDDGPWEVERGMKNTTRGETYSFEGEDILDIWSADSCNMINGSDSSVFELPKKERNQRIYVFSQDFCRSIYIEYENETKQFGISAIRYSNTGGPFDYTSGDNVCFCPFVEDEEGDEHQICPPNGVADVTPCMKAPVLISFPHFYMGDPKLLEYPKGLNPKKELHENYVHLEPTTATPLAGVKRIQMNIEVKKIDEFDLLENVTHGIFPIIWIEEGVILPNDFVKILKSNFAKISVLNVFKYFMIFGGFGAMVAGIVLILRKERMFCFANNETVEITRNKPTNENVTHPSSGRINHAFESNTAMNTVGAQNNKNIAPNNNNRRAAGAQQWNSQVWHTGEANGNSN